MSDLFKDLEEELSKDDKYSDDEVEEVKQEAKPKAKAKKPLSEIAKKARLENLRKGREKRMKMVQHKKKIEKQFEAYEEDSESDDDEEEYYKPSKKLKHPQDYRAIKGGAKVHRLQAELDAMKNIVKDLKKKKDKQVRQPVVINNQLPPMQPQVISGGSNDIAELLKTRMLKF